MVQDLRAWLWAEGLLRAKLIAGKDPTDPDTAKFRDYFDYEEPVARVPSHRALAAFRGVRTGHLGAQARGARRTASDRKGCTYSLG